MLMARFAQLLIDNTNIQLPILESVDGKYAVDISRLKDKAQMTVYDPNLNNTAITRSSITWIDAGKGTLLYRGYDIEELVNKSTFVETSYLLSHGELPNQEQLKEYSTALSKHSMIHESMRNFFDAFPGDAHPLAILATMVTALSSYYPATYEENLKKGVDIRIRLLAKVRTLAAWSYKKSQGQPTVYPRDELPYCTNFLNMLFAVPPEPHTVSPEDDKILNQILILYSDHEQNVATSTVRMVGSTRANLFACINAGMCALWGVRESDANLPPIYMLEDMIDRNLSPEQYFEKFIQGKEPLRSNGFGHPGYDTIEARSLISKRLFHEYLSKHGDIAERDPLIKKALEVEEFVLGHPYLQEIKIYPNLDFYSALIFRLLGIPANMNNVIRVIGKMSGWLAHWIEQRYDPDKHSYRPTQLYSGKLHRPYEPVEKRS